MMAVVELWKTKRRHLEACWFLIYNQKDVQFNISPGLKMCSTIFEKHLSHEAVINQYFNNIFVQTGAQNVFFFRSVKIYYF